MRVTELKDILVHQKDLELHRVPTVTDSEISTCVTDLGKDLVKEGHCHHQQIDDTEEVIVVIAGVTAGTESKIGFLVLKAETEKAGIIILARDQTQELDPTQLKKLLKQMLINQSRKKAQEIVLKNVLSLKRT